MSNYQINNKKLEKTYFFSFSESENEKKLFFCDLSFDKKTNNYDNAFKLK